MAGNYNVNTYNSALYNAGRDELGAVARSIIQAHTGPHIQAVVGSDPRLPADQSGISFISDFNIREGTVRKPPTSFFFPDLRARVNAVQTRQVNLDAFLKAISKADMPAAAFPVAFIPDLIATIFGLIEKDLPASIIGELATLDLPAILQIVQEDLGGQILGIASPELGGRILGINAPNLGAIIWAPTDLPATLQTVQFNDLPGDIFAFRFSDMPASMFGLAAPILNARVKGFAAAENNLPGVLLSRDELGLPALVISSIPGPNDVTGSIGSTGAYENLLSLIRRTSPADGDLKATIGISIGNTFDLPAEISFLSAIGLAATLTSLALGRNDKFLNATLQPVHAFDILANISSNENLKNLAASIFANFDTADLGGFIRAAETFVTALLTVSTYSTANLRATIGNPSCAGGSASVLLSAIATAQHANDLGGLIQSFIETDLGASINQNELFFAIDSINVKFSPKGIRTNTFLVTDTIGVTFSPFRGLNLGAFIQAVLSNIDLSATVTAEAPLPRVEPAVHRLTAAEIRPDRAFDTQEVRIQMEGELLNYFYVNGTDDAFIQDANENWRINVRGFRPIADGLFGEFGSARVCRLGNISSFKTLDEAMRACIAAVIGLQGERDLTASVSASGDTLFLPAQLSVSDIFSDLGSIVNRVFPVDITASITPDDLGILEIPAAILPSTPATASVGASIDGMAEIDLISTITGVP